MDNDQWLTYGNGIGLKPQAMWIETLAISQFIKNQLYREIDRLAGLVYGGKWFDKERTEIPPDELANLRHDLMLWDRPDRVLLLLRSRHGSSFLGPKSLAATVAAMETMLATTTTPE